MNYTVCYILVLLSIVKFALSLEQTVNDFTNYVPFQYSYSPSKNIQMYVAHTNVKNLQYIKYLDESIQEYIVHKDPSYIVYIKYPTTYIQKYIIDVNPKYMLGVYHQTLESQLYMVGKDHRNINYIHITNIEIFNYILIYSNTQTRMYNINKLWFMLLTIASNVFYILYVVCFTLTVMEFIRLVYTDFRLY